MACDACRTFIYAVFVEMAWRKRQKEARRAAEGSELRTASSAPAKDNGSAGSTEMAATLAAMLNRRKSLRPTTDDLAAAVTAVATTSAGPDHEKATPRQEPETPIQEIALAT